MSVRNRIVIDANEAAADVAFRTSEVVAIYPITPASPMGEHADAWAGRGRPNLWGQVPTVVEMQSEAGAAGTLHGALQAGALTTTFTASQGLLLMLPDMFKIAGELTAGVIHVAARSVATHALSIFCDHSDIYAARSTGYGMLVSRTAQEAHDLALVSLAVSLRARIPFVHFFDGFRTSHELRPVERLGDEILDAMLPPHLRAAHRRRGLRPESPVVRGTAQNPDAFFQAREAINPFYDAVPEIAQQVLSEFAERSGRRYDLFDYCGAPDAQRVVVVIGSAAQTAEETVDWLCARGEKVGVLSVRMLRPWSSAHFLRALPASVRSLAVLDRTKEPGAAGEPLYLDVLAAVHGPDADRAAPRVVGGRYGLSSKEMTPAMFKAVYDGLDTNTLRHGFTVGIRDDVTHLSIPFDATLDIESADTVRAVFFGLGSDGTVGANKNSIKIIGEDTELEAQGFFVYDSKKSGAVTVSHLRFGPRVIRSTYLIRNASFVACHQWHLLEQRDVLALAADGATLLLNAPYDTAEVWDRLPREIQDGIIEKKLDVYAIDAESVARAAGLGRRINTVMQVCFFALAGVLPRDEAIARIKAKIAATYARKGEEIVRLNLEAVDATLSHLQKVEVGAATSAQRRPPTVVASAPDFVQRVTALMIAGHGDDLPVSAFAPDGSWPLATSRYEKRNIAVEIPAWDPSICIQCNKCALICPHAAVRVKVYDNTYTEGAPATFQHMEYKAKEFRGQAYTVQVAPEDCTGCGLCVAVCPAKDRTNPRHKSLDMVPQRDRLEAERDNWDFFAALPAADRTAVTQNVKGSQFLEPLFEFSGACAGCGETPYVKLLTQLFGDRAVIANATGCSSIYGGNLPTTPYCMDSAGRGPAWSNSLFEDNAEFGLGLRLGLDQHAVRARQLTESLAPAVGDEIVCALLEADQSSEAGIIAQRERVRALRAALSGLADPRAVELLDVADHLVRKSLWIVGGDGWAYDIGFGGVDHVLASGANVNILVLDTEVYSNTGGQQSKATPLGAVAKFAANGKARPKKDLGALAMTYGDVYVAQVAIGAKDAHTYKAFVEAESWPGASLIIAYSPCIAHGYDLTHQLDHQRLAYSTGYWPLYTFDPRRAATGAPGVKLEMSEAEDPVKRYLETETRFRILKATQPARAGVLWTAAQDHVDRRLATLARLSRGEE